MFANSALAVSNPTRKLVAAHSSMRYAHAHHLRATYAPCRPEEVTIIPREEGKSNVSSPCNTLTARAIGTTQTPTFSFA